jgi:putative aldouronate transport system substrate-binding protein
MNKEAKQMNKEAKHMNKEAKRMNGSKTARAIALLLAACLALAMGAAGCSGGAGGQTSAAASTAAEQTSAAAEQTSAAGETAAAAEQTSAAAEQSQPESGGASGAGDAAEPPASEPAAGGLPYAELSWYNLAMTSAQAPDARMVADAIAAYLLEKLNVKVNLHFDEDQSMLATKLAAGEDLGIVPAAAGYATDASNGLMYPLDELLDEYGQGVRAAVSDEIFDVMRVGGKIYGVPSIKDNGYWMAPLYNKTLGDRLGLDYEAIKALSHNWYNYYWESTFLDAMERRTALLGEVETPLAGTWNLINPMDFAVEAPIGITNVLAVFNVPGVEQIGGYDPYTAYNFYFTEEYKEQVRTAHEFVQRGIFVNDRQDSQLDMRSGEQLFAGNWGQFYVPAGTHGDQEWVVLPPANMGEVYVDQASYTSAQFCISAACGEPERAMMAINLLFSDPEFYKLCKWGIKGEHFTEDAEGNISIYGSPRNPSISDAGYSINSFTFVGNHFLVKWPKDHAGPNNEFDSLAKAANEVAVKTAHFGFSLDQNPIAGEIAACNNVVAEYHDELYKGRYNSLDEAYAKLEEFKARLEVNGSQRIIDEVQAQADAWLASR